MPSLRQWYRYFLGGVLEKDFYNGTITSHTPDAQNSCAQIKKTQSITLVPFMRRAHDSASRTNEFPDWWFRPARVRAQLEQPGTSRNSVE